MSSIRLGSFEIPEQALSWKFHLSSGPGGQNVNKVSTAVELRFNIASAQLDTAVADRLRDIARNRINNQDELVVQARQHRSQERNRQDALDRLANLLKEAKSKPKPRIATRPTRASKRARLEDKRRRSVKKQNRRSANSDFD